jgi:hypothetical protein
VCVCRACVGCSPALACRATLMFRDALCSGSSRFTFRARIYAASGRRGGHDCMRLCTATESNFIRCTPQMRGVHWRIAHTTCCRQATGSNLLSASGHWHTAQMRGVHWRIAHTTYCRQETGSNLLSASGHWHTAHGCNTTVTSSGCTLYTLNSK